MTAHAPAGSNWAVGGDTTRLCLTQQPNETIFAEAYCGANFNSSMLPHVPAEISATNVGSLDVVFLVPASSLTETISISAGSSSNAVIGFLRLNVYLQVDRLADVGVAP